MNETFSSLIFPSSFPLKVMGLNNEAFEQAVREILQKHLHGAPIEFASQLSSSGKYRSITATFMATSRDQLDSLYRELNGHKLVVMTL